MLTLVPLAGKGPKATFINRSLREGPEASQILPHRGRIGARIGP